MKKIILINTFIASLFVFFSCSQNSFDAPNTTPTGERINSTISIQSLEDTYMVTDTTSKGYYTSDPILSSTQLVFNGIVTSNDLMGNIYKYITVQEDNAMTAAPRAIRISIDANNVSYFYPAGQRVSVIANKWHIGKYGDTPQMGTYYERPSDGRISPGAMPMNIVRQTVIPYDDADINAVVPKEMTIAQIKSYATPKNHHRELDWQLIKIKNVFFNQHGDGTSGRPADNIIFAPSTGGIGYPQAITIQDANGQTIDICTSEYSSFANTIIPAASYIGDITCIVSWYQSRIGVSGSFQLTLRSLHDLGAGFEGYLANLK